MARHTQVESLQPTSASNLSTYHDLSGCRVLVVGLGRWGGGVAVTRWLVEQGAKVVVTDSADGEALSESLKSLEGVDVAFRLGRHDERDLDEADLVVLNPAVNKRTSDFFRSILQRGVPYTTEINLFCARCPATIVGVTGTFGKSTTAAMIAAVLDRAIERGESGYRRAWLGGNIGRSLLPELSGVSPRDVVVLEISNAQLEDLPLIPRRPELAVITNIEPHHLDRYEHLDGYIEAKLNILPVDGSTLPLVHGSLDSAVLELIAGRPVRAIPVVQPESPLALRVPGEHNRANAACAMTVAHSLGVGDATARAALAEFAGLPDRLAHVGTIDGADYFNDSKSTAPASTVVALRSFDRPVVALVGGLEIDDSIDACVAELRNRCRAVIGVGAMGRRFTEALRRLGPAVRADEPGDHGAASACKCCVAADLVEAVAEARRLARPGDVVLLSPGAPSFDQYSNYRQRGAHFHRLVLGG